VVRVRRAVVAAVAPSVGPGLAATEEERLRGAATLARREVAIDELPVRGDAHAGIVDAGCDSYRSREPSIRRKKPPIPPGCTIRVTPASAALCCIIASAVALGAP
jgi:hypothetical protein